MSFTVTTIAVLLSTITVLLLVYTHRFLALANLLRSLIKEYKSEHCDYLLKEIEQLKRRVYIIKHMQFTNFVALIVSILSIFAVFINNSLFAKIFFIVALLHMIISTLLAALEVHLSASSLDVELDELRIACTKNSN